MGLNDLTSRVVKLEVKMETLENEIVRELAARKEGQADIAAAQHRIEDSVTRINQKIWYAMGFIGALTLVLQIVLKVFLK